MFNTKYFSYILNNPMNCYRYELVAIISDEKLGYRKIAPGSRNVGGNKVPIVKVKKDEAREIASRMRLLLMLMLKGNMPWDGTIILKISSRFLSWQNAMLKEQHLHCDLVTK